MCSVRPVCVWCSTCICSISLGNASSVSRSDRSSIVTLFFSSSSGATICNCPWCKIATQSATLSTSWIWWELRNTVWPAAARSIILSKNERRTSGSRPDVGSSRINSSGSNDIARDNATLARIPLDKSRILVSCGSWNALIRSPKDFKKPSG